MKKILLFIVAIFCIECGYAQTRILPLGESTTGWDKKDNNPSYHAWRKKFCELLTADGINYDMIGPFNNGATTYDGDHAGYPGNPTKNVRSGLNNFYYKQPTKIPDIIIVLLGTNDCGTELENGSTADLSLLIDDCVRFYPNAQVIVSSIPPLSDGAYTSKRLPGVAAANVVAFNKQLPSLCAAKAAEGKNVTFVDGSAHVKLDDLDDGIHLKESGNDKLATAFYNAVKRPLELGFEYGFTPWSKYNNASINEATNNIRSGIKSGYFSGGGAYYKVKGLTPGATYVVKAWVKAVSGSEIWVIANGFNGTANPGKQMTSTSWTQTDNIEITMGSNNTEVTLHAWTGNGSSAYFDNYTIVRTNCINCRTASAEVESSQQTESLTLNLHPNPANQEVSISLAEFEGESAVQVRMRDMAGKLFLSKQVQLGAGVDQVTLPVSHLPQGLFFVTVQGSKVSRTAKLVITK